MLAELCEGDLEAAVAPRGGLLHAPDVYMDKIAIGPGFDDDVIDLEAPVTENVLSLARAFGTRSWARWP